VLEATIWKDYITREKVVREISLMKEPSSPQVRTV
jgi:hypothetical protein